VGFVYHSSCGLTQSGYAARPPFILAAVAASFDRLFRRGLFETKVIVGVILVILSHFEVVAIVVIADKVLVLLRV
jgi:hypothetical protein